MQKALEAARQQGGRVFFGDRVGTAAYPQAYYAPAPVYVTPAPVYYGYPGPTVWIGGRWVSHGGYYHHRW